MKMSQPKIEMIPLHEAVRLDAPTTLDLLLRITPPQHTQKLDRPALNLGLVIDRSGSMSGQNKMGFARDAAIFAVQQLLATDQISVTIFDDAIDVLVPNTTGEERDRIIGLLKGIEPRGSTALHGGWLQGAELVRQRLFEKGLNRVLLISDGQANVGETNPDMIATDVNRFKAKGVSTSTMGVGDDYNEDLMEAMANSGDGNYYYIESPQQLADVFQTELQGLVATFGHTVSFDIEPGEGVAVADTLNDFERLPNGRMKLPNLLHATPTTILFRLNVPPMAQERVLCHLRIAWTSPRSGERQRIRIPFSLPPVDAATWEGLQPAAEVQEQASLLSLARMKKQASSLLQEGDRQSTIKVMLEMEELLDAMPESEEKAREVTAVHSIQVDLQQGDDRKFLKRSKMQAMQRRQSKK
jgi:Ca-activated chloride channel family protein